MGRSQAFAPPRAWRLYVLLAVVLGALLLADIALPKGIGGGILYIVFVLGGLVHPHRHAPIVLSGIASATSILGYALSPGRIENWLSVLDFSLSFAVIWFAGMAIHRYRIARTGQAEAEFASNEKSRMMANLSHELRTPLNAIIGFSDLMQAEVYGPVGNARYCGYIRDILGSGRHLLALVNDILDISRIEAGILEIDAETPVDLAEIIDSALSLCSGQASQCGVTVAAEVEQGLPALRGDPTRVRQILINLLSNAVKFTPAGGKVLICARTSSSGGIELSVVDTGIGIPAESIGAALTPFRQLDSGHGRKFEGVGLGLPISQRLVELHGGTLTIVSRPGAGTTVNAVFPRGRVAASRSSRATPIHADGA